MARLEELGRCVDSTRGVGNNSMQRNNAPASSIATSPTTPPPTSPVFSTPLPFPSTPIETPPRRTTDASSNANSTSPVLGGAASSPALLRSSLPSLPPMAPAGGTPTLEQQLAEAKRVLEVQHRAMPPLGGSAELRVCRIFMGRWRVQRISRRRCHAVAGSPSRTSAHSHQASRLLPQPPLLCFDCMDVCQDAAGDGELAQRVKSLLQLRGIPQSDTSPPGASAVEASSLGEVKLPEMAALREANEQGLAVIQDLREVLAGLMESRSRRSPNSSQLGGV